VSDKSAESGTLGTRGIIHDSKRDSTIYISAIDVELEGGLYILRQHGSIGTYVVYHRGCKLVIGGTVFILKCIFRDIY
jgi:hypothetical protein